MIWGKAMLELAIKGNRYYWAWLMFLTLIIAAGIVAYLMQFNIGLAVTGLGRDVSWGFYIAQLTFLVGVAASAVMVVLPYYLHNYKVFGQIYLSILHIPWLTGIFYVGLLNPLTSPLSVCSTTISL